MSQENLSVSVYSLWNAASLNTSIAKLYPAGDTPGSKMNDAGTPEATAIPRAEYFLTVPPPANKTRRSRVYQASVMIRVWDSTKETVDGYVTSISDTFINSDDASAGNQMTMTGGDILEVDDGGVSVEKVDDAVFMGELVFLVRYRINNVVPA